MQTIETYVIQQTATLPRRIKGVQVIEGNTPVSVIFSDTDPVFNGLRDDQYHHRVALEVMSKLNWVGKLVGGLSPNGGMIWVFTDVIRDSIEREIETCGITGGETEKLMLFADSVYEERIPNEQEIILESIS